MPSRPRWSAADVEDNADRALVERQARAQDAAARGLQHGHFDEGVLQDGLGAAGARAVALDAAHAVEVDAVGGGHADELFHGGVDVADHARDGGLAVGAGDGDDGNAGVGLARRKSRSIMASPTGRDLPSEG